MKIKIRSICDLCIGVLCVCAVILGYYKDIEYMGEYCFLSGMITGIIFLFSFGYSVKTKKKLPVWLYFDCMIMLTVILIATLIMKLNLDGAFWFIHIINPIIILLYWIIFCNHRELLKSLQVMTCLIFPVFYFPFAFVFWKITGFCPFPASLIFEMNGIGYIILSIIAVLAIFLALGYVLHFLNILLNKRKSINK